MDGMTNPTPTHGTSVEDAKNNQNDPQNVVDTWKRPCVQFFQVATCGDWWSDQVPSLLTGAAVGGAYILGKEAFDPSLYIKGGEGRYGQGRLRLVPPESTQASLTYSNGESWFQSTNESGYHHVVKLCRSSTFWQEEIARIAEVEGYLVYSNQPESLKKSCPNSLIINPAQDVFSIKNLGTLIWGHQYKSRNLVLQHAFPEIFHKVKRVLVELPELPDVDSTRKEMFQDGQTSFLKSGDFSYDPLTNHLTTEIYWLGAMVPHLETLYLLDRRITLQPGKTVPQVSQRFYGYKCTFVEVDVYSSSMTKQGVTDEEKQSRDTDTIWHIPLESPTFHAISAFNYSYKNLKDKLKSTPRRGLPVEEFMVGVNHLDKRGNFWEWPEVQSGINSDFKLKILARLDGTID